MEIVKIYKYKRIYRTDRSRYLLKLVLHDFLNNRKESIKLHPTFLFNVKLWKSLVFFYLFSWKYSSTNWLCSFSICRICCKSSGISFDTFSMRKFYWRNDRMFTLYTYIIRVRERKKWCEWSTLFQNDRMSSIDIRETSCVLNLFVSAIITADLIDEWCIKTSQKWF